MAVVGPASPADRAPPVLPAVPVQPPPPLLVTDAFAKDVILSWFRGEFAAANAIIDALCGYLSQLGGVSDYEAVFQAVHRRRMNWIPVLHMQEFHSVAEVVLELSRVAARKLGEESQAAGVVAGSEKAGNVNSSTAAEEFVKEEEPAAEEEEEEEIKPCLDDERKESAEKAPESNGSESGNVEVIDEEEDSPDSDITDSGSQEVHPVPEEMELCSNHEQCESRSSQIKLTKGFAAKEPVNLVKGMKLYENIFTDSELSKLTHFVSDLRTAGHNGELSGETYILFNKQIKGNKRELLQFGVPIFGHRQEDATSNNETSNIQPIPPLLQGVIDHLVQWQLLPVYKKPNSCIINFFDEGEYSQPFWKPPHLDQPISTLFLSESTLVFGRFLVNDGEGNYKGKFTLSPKEGSLLVMRGNSCDMARHATCPSPNERIAISFFRVRPDSTPAHSPHGPMTLWNPTSPGPYSYEPMDMVMPKWGLLPAPVVMLAPAPVPQMAVSPKKIPGSGTGVFLPWNGSHRKPAKHLPPRAQKGRVLHLTHAVETHVAEPASA
ncbi:hypothetical protein CDL15_Pgr018498 [Punica granatum]|uniref:Fe2OG dioxygenase domain-containing protein n=1 Tax=Punica granatum TaxID=22663 RepID=A0A218WZJ4_PUNGR|nr:hypothetical protein CDL15_Pgr018498 [Punica granatum]